jgi:hypothetical protein
MMKRVLLAALALACVPWPLEAQNAITQEGTVLQNSPMMFRGNNRARQGAPVGGAPSGQTVTTGDSVVGGRCDYSAPTDDPSGYYFLCIDAKTGTISTGGTKSGHGLTFVIDGVTYTVPISASFIGTDIAVANNAALQALIGTPGQRAVRLGFRVPGDGGLAGYNWSATGCAIADNGAQVQSSGTGCWIADLQSVRATAQVWGCVGDGVADDTACVQAAITAAGRLGIPLSFNTTNLYRIMQPLTVAAPVALEGPFRYGYWHPGSASGNPSEEKCSWGLMTPATGINMLNVTATTGTIRGLCIDMTGNTQLVATAGTAINVAPPSAIDLFGWHAHRAEHDPAALCRDCPQWRRAFRAECCGAKARRPTRSSFQHNSIVSPGIGIEVGKNTVWATTVGITMTDNGMVCGRYGTPRGKGLVVHDGAVWYDGTQNGPLGCTVGIEIVPVGIGTDPQWVQFNGDGVFGDQSTLHDLWIHPGQGGWLSPVRVSGKGPWANQTSNGNAVLIDCTAPTESFCDGITIDNLIAFGGSDQNQPVVDIKAGPGGPFNFSLTNSNIRQGGKGAVPGGNAVGLNIKFFPGSDYAGNWNITNNIIGAVSLGCCTAPNTVMPVAMALDLSGSTSVSSAAINITGNNFSNHLNLPNKPLALNLGASTGHRIIIRNNIGIEDAAYRPLTAAATVNLIDAYPNYVVTGTTPISTINGGWAGRTIQMGGAATNSLNMAIGGNICAPAIVNGNATLLTWPFGSSCWQHVP